MILAPFDINTDLTRCLQMAVDMHKASIFSALEYDKAKVIKLFLTADEHNGDPYFFWVVRDPVIGAIGMMIGFARSHFCSEDTYSIDLLLWVDTPYRGTQSGEMLVTRYLEWAVELGVTLPMIGSSTGIDIDRTKAFYERCGFECVGHNFIARI